LCSGGCKDLMNDNNNCGMCGHACPAPESCSNGGCCPQFQTRCSGICTNLRSDDNNCGSCGNRCPAGERCSDGGHCCPVGKYSCNGVCTNLLSDPNNCGNCGSTCGTGYYCSNGYCIHVPTGGVGSSTTPLPITTTPVPGGCSPGFQNCYKYCIPVGAFCCPHNGLIYTCPSGSTMCNECQNFGHCTGCSILGAG
jgi:hypothetical protein